MPYHWTTEADRRTLELTQHQSMTETGFVTFMGATLVLVVIPLLAVLGTPILWVLLAFIAMAIGGVWFAISRNQSDGTRSETLIVAPEHTELVHRDSKGREQRWEANPYWVTVHLHPGDKPVEHYLTLKGGGREVEIGVFLSPEERQILYGELQDVFLRTKRPGSSEGKPPEKLGNDQEHKDRDRED